MALKMPSFKIFTQADAKTRVFLVFAAVAVTVLVIFFIVRYFSGGTAGTGTRVANAPSSLQTVPGSQMSPEFYRAVVKANEQASKQAEITGGSAVPTLINVPGQQAGFPDQNCTIVCPSDDNVNVADDINALIKQGKLTAEEGKRLIDLANANVPIEQYAAALDELVKQGKLTPEQARALLEKYKKQHANALLNQSGAMMDSMIKNGQLPVEVATGLLALQKRGASPAEYAAELNRLVREGKLSPAAAAQLLAQYTQQQAAEEAKKGVYALQQMAKNGEITPDVANALAALQAKGVSVDDYAAELNRLVAAGKMTPAAAAKLLEQYKKQRAGLGPTQALNDLVKQEQAKAAAFLDDLVKKGRLQPDDSARIMQMIRDCKSPEEIQAELTKLVQAKRVAPEDAQKIMAFANKAVLLCAQAKRLATLQGNNATLDEYAAELKRAVAAGLITPETAAALLEQYRAFKTPVTLGPGTPPGVEANLPGTAEFAKLQQAVQAGAPSVAPITPDQFAVPPAPPAQTTTTTTTTTVDDQARLERIAQLQAAMSAQAQNLINAWQPPVMSHRDGSPEEKSKTAGGAAGGAGGVVSKETTITTTTTLVKPLIKAGTILFAILDTAVNSDYPDTPVMATIIQGPLKGAKLLGKLQLAQGMDKVSLIFNLMDKDDWITTKSINAFAIDPDTARTVMASSVDYHYLKKYGAIMATSFLTGFSQAISQSGSTTTNGIFGPTTTHPTLSFGNKVMEGFGQVGTTIGNSIANWINTPTTVKVNSGVGLGILFMSEVPGDVPGAVPGPVPSTVPGPAPVIVPSNVPGPTPVLVPVPSPGS